MGQEAGAARIRAAFLLFPCANGIIAAIGFALAGLPGTWLVGPVLVALPAYGLGIGPGTRMFHLASERTFRRACYAMIAVSAVLSLPLLDRLLR